MLFTTIYVAYDIVRLSTCICEYDILKFTKNNFTNTLKKN